MSRIISYRELELDEIIKDGDIYGLSNWNYSDYYKCSDRGNPTVGLTLRESKLMDLSHFLKVVRPICKKVIG